VAAPASPSTTRIEKFSAPRFCSITQRIFTPGIDLGSSAETLPLILV